MTHSSSLVVIFCHILTFGSFEDFQSSWHCGKVQHEPGIGSHILFKGAPIWPTAPLICEAAPPVCLLHHCHVLCSHFSYSGQSRFFFKCKNVCSFIILCCNNLICICYIGGNKENNNTQLLQNTFIFYLFTDLFLLFCHHQHHGISSCPCVFLSQPGALCRHTLR